jgi:hypothetical protein
MKPSDLSRELRRSLDALPQSLLDRSGSIFYSGREAFSGQRDLYILGLNPGGSPVAQAAETIGRHMRAFHERSQPWSEYRDESWRGTAPGTHGMQPRVLHMLGRLARQPCETPAGNVVFVRSASEAALGREKQILLKQCWPVHNAVIDQLGVKVVLCFGGTAGRWVREQLGADDQIDRFVETNKRGWQSMTHATKDKRFVVTVSHPGRADWRNPLADPTPLVERALALALTPP